MSPIEWLFIFTALLSPASTYPLDISRVSLTSPECKVKQHVLFCDYLASNKDTVLFSTLDEDYVKKIFLRNIKELHINYKLCNDVVLQNIATVHLVKIDVNVCNKSVAFSAKNCTLDSIPVNAVDLYLNECEVDILSTNSSLQNMNIIGSKLNTLNLTKVLAKGTEVFFQDSSVSILQNLKLGSESSLQVHDTVINIAKGKGLEINDGRVRILNSILTSPYGSFTISSGGVVTVANNGSEFTINVAAAVNHITSCEEPHSVTMIVPDETTIRKEGRSSSISSFSETKIACECLSDTYKSSGQYGVLLGICFIMLITTWLTLAFMIFFRKEVLRELLQKQMKSEEMSEPIADTSTNDEQREEKKGLLKQETEVEMKGLLKQETEVEMKGLVKEETDLEKTDLLKEETEVLLKTDVQIRENDLSDTDATHDQQLISEMENLLEGNNKAQSNTNDNQMLCEDLQSEVGIPQQSGDSEEVRLLKESHNRYQRIKELVSKTSTKAVELKATYEKAKKHFTKEKEAFKSVIESFGSSQYEQYYDSNLKRHRTEVQMRLQRLSSSSNFLNKLQKWESSCIKNFIDLISHFFSEVHDLVPTHTSGENDHNSPASLNENLFISIEEKLDQILNRLFASHQKRKKKKQHNEMNEMDENFEKLYKHCEEQPKIKQALEHTVQSINSEISNFEIKLQEECDRDIEWKIQRSEKLLNWMFNTQIGNLGAPSGNDL